MSWLVLDTAFLGGGQEDCLCKTCGFVPLKRGEKKTLSPLELQPVTEDISALWHSLLLQHAYTYPYQKSQIEIPAPLGVLKFPCKTKHYSFLTNPFFFSPVFLKRLSFFQPSQQEFNRNYFPELPLPLS